MRIGANIPSLLASNNMGKAYAATSLSSLRMSSGYRINSAADDAAGLAISIKIRQQVKGLAQASKNSSNAVSLIQTAEGALDGVHSMLQRIRELAVQSANDTYEPEDRLKMQDEIDQLIEEINSISLKTEYNKMKLLSGECDRIMRTTCPQGNGGLDILRISDDTPYGDLAFYITSLGTEAEFDSSGLTDAFTLFDRALVGTTITVTVTNGENEYTFESDPIDEDDTQQDVLDKINAALGASGYVANAPDDGPGIVGSITSTVENKGYSISVSTGDAALDAQLGLLGVCVPGSDDTRATYVTYPVEFDPLRNLIGQTVTINGQSFVIEETDDRDTLEQKITDAALAAGLDVTPGTPPNIIDGLNTTAVGADQKITITGESYVLERLGLVGTFTDGKGIEVEINSGGTDIFTNAAVSVVGNRVTFTNSSGAEICLDLKEPLDPANIGVDYTISTKLGALVIQVGANKDMGMYMTIPKINAKTIEIDTADVTTGEAATKSIDIADKAIALVNSVRSRLGAYQNRLEYTVLSLDNANVNASDSLSRIMDTDMAAEMTEYAKFNVMYQAGMSILAQSNARPQQVLQLLQ